MRLLGLALKMAACPCITGDTAGQSEAHCLTQRHSASNIVSAAPVLLQMQGALHTLHDPSALGAGGGLYGDDPQPVSSAGDAAGAVLSKAVSAVAGSSGGVEALEGVSLFATELPERDERSFGRQVDEGNVSVAESSSLAAEKFAASNPEGTVMDIVLNSQLQLSADEGNVSTAELSSLAAETLAASNPDGTVMDIVLNSELQLSAAIRVVDPSAADGPDGGTISAAEMPEAVVGSDEADGTVIDVPLNSELEVSATNTDGQSPSSSEGEKSESDSDSDLADDSSDPVDGTQDRDPTGDRGDQAARDDNDLAEDSTDGLPGEGVDHTEGGHVDPAPVGGIGGMSIDRERYEEDWAKEWRPNPNDTDHSRNNTHGHATHGEVVKNSLAILGHRPQIAASVVVVAAYVVTRR